MFYRSIVFVGLLLFFVSQNAIAQTAMGTLAVTATVGSVSTCLLNSVTPMIFPSYNPINSNSDDATASISITCGTGIPYDIGIDEGHGIGATEADRTMTKVPSETTRLLPYGLFQNSNHTSNWGDSIGKDTMQMVGNNLPQLLTVYGKINAGQVVEPGVYMDRVTVIVTF